jgi:HAD superfamily hydrolase (TIGR01509 family)
MSTIHGVLLDIDGTLVDSNDAHAHAWVKAMTEAGLAITFDEVRPLIGMGGDKLLPKACGIKAESPLGQQISDRRGELFLAEHVGQLRPTRGAKELLVFLKAKGFKLAVASSAKADELKPLLAICGADRLIDSQTSSDDADKSKPDPDILHAALRTIGLSKEEVVMLGDTPYDVEAARLANIRVIAVRCGGWGDNELQADAIYNDPAELMNQFMSSILSQVRRE